MTKTTTASPELMAQIKLPEVCDKDNHEQNAFEAMAAALKYNMDQHPMFYLFLNKETSAFRDGWKNGLQYAINFIQDQLKELAQKKDAQDLETLIGEVQARADGVANQFVEELLDQAETSKAVTDPEHPSNLGITKYLADPNLAEKLGVSEEALKSDGQWSLSEALGKIDTTYGPRGYAPHHADWDNAPSSALKDAMPDFHTRPRGMNQHHTERAILYTVMGLLGTEGVLKEHEARAVASHQHYKGGLYYVIGDVKHTETQEVLTAYVHLYPHQPSFFVRPKDMFDGLNDAGQQRFVKIREQGPLNAETNEMEFDTDAGMVKAFLRLLAEAGDGWSDWASSDANTAGVGDDLLGSQELAWKGAFNHMHTALLTLAIRDHTYRMYTESQQSKQLSEGGSVLSIKDHDIRQLVSDLTDVAEKYGATQQLRDRIQAVVLPVLKPQ